jgi:hypothetical protein
MNIFTNVPEIDTNILQEIDDDYTLFTICQTNQYVNQLCHNDYVLNLRLTYIRKKYNNYQSVLRGINPENGTHIQIGSVLYHRLLKLYSL